MLVADIKLSLFDEIEIALRMGKSGEIDPNTLIEKVFLFGENIAKENGAWMCKIGQNWAKVI